MREAKAMPKDDALPILAAAAIEGGAGGDPAVKQLLVMLLEDALEKRRKDREKQERLQQSAVQTAQEQAAAKEAQQKTCSHLKQDNRTTRLSGQRLSNGQVALVCSFCFKEFHIPPGPGQEAPPRELMPPVDEIGG